MNKILLVYEDYADLISVEGALKKVGFDVIGLSSEYAIAEQILAFNPDLVVGAGRGGKVSSLGVGKRLKEMTRWTGKAVLIFSANVKPAPQDLIRLRADMILEAPVANTRLVQVIGRMLGHDETTLLERLNKSMQIDSSQKSSMVSTSGGKSISEGEAIYVKGTLESSSDGDLIGSEEGLETEKIVDEESYGFTLNPEQQGRKVSFKFGDRVSEAGEQKAVSGDDEVGAAEAFPDVDLKALEKELMGGGTPEVERITEVPEDIEEKEELKSSDDVETHAEGLKSSVAATESEPVSDHSLPEAPMESEGVLLESLLGEEEQEIQLRAQQDLQNAEKGLSERIEKYSKMVADVKVSPKSSLTRVETRRRQRQLVTDWDSENINEIDKLRREFTKALFKK